MMVTWNVPHGPWCEDVRWRQVMQVVAEHFEVEQPHMCPLFHALAPSILRDRGSGSRIGEDGIEEVVWSWLQEESPWRIKGDKVSLNRFLGAIQTGRREDSLWRMRLFGYMLTCLHFDWSYTYVLFLKKFETLSNMGLCLLGLML